VVEMSVNTPQPPQSATEERIGRRRRLDEVLSELPDKSWDPDEDDIEYATMQAEVSRGGTHGTNGPLSKSAPESSVVLDIVTVGDVPSQPVRWLWKNRIPFGKLSLLEGMPDVGKSNLSLAIAAAVSTGGTLPGGERVEAGDVLIVTVEDGIADTIRPRLEAAGADVSRVHVLRSVSYNDGVSERIPKIPDDLPAIHEAILRTYAVLVIIDTLGSHTSAKRKGGDDVDMGDALSAVAKMAEDTGAAILALRHLQKAPVGNAITAGIGGIGVIGRARSCLLAARDPDDTSKRVLAVVKKNLAPDGVPSLAYRIEGKDVEGAGSVSHLVWDGESKYSADELIAAGRDREDRSKVDEAIEWLREYLVGGRQKKAEILAAAKGAGITYASLDRAKVRLGVTHERDGYGKGAFYWWNLPISNGSADHASHDEEPKSAHAPHAQRNAEHGGSRGDKSLSNNGHSILSNGATHRPVSPRPLATLWDASETIDVSLEQMAIDAYARRYGEAP
jgi:hypothetical protein